MIDGESEGDDVMCAGWVNQEDREQKYVSVLWDRAYTTPARAW